MRPFTADAIHNWDTAYIQRQYADLPWAVQEAAHAAMCRHHQRGTDAAEEARRLNAIYGLKETP